MDLVDLMYRYINKLINGEELLSELQKINLKKYSKEEKEINRLTSDVKQILENIPNEIDATEINRMENYNDILGKLEQIKDFKPEDEKAKEVILQQIDKLNQEKSIKRDGGKLYYELFDLLTKHPLVNKYAEQMDSKALLDFIASYIHVPLPPVINQEIFNELVNVGIESDKREAIWRLAFNYSGKNMDFSLIEDYFIEKRDNYYLMELISAADEDIDLEKVIKKAVATKDKVFMMKCANLALDYGIITKDDIERIKRENNL